MHVEETPGGHTLGSISGVRHSGGTDTSSHAQEQSPKHSLQAHPDKPHSGPQPVCPEVHVSRVTHKCLQSVAPVEALRREDVQTRVRLRIASKKQVVKSTAGKEGNDSEGVDLVRSPRESDTLETSKTGGSHCKIDEEINNMGKEKGNCEDSPLFPDWEDSKGDSLKGNEGDVPPRYQLPSVEERLQAIKEERGRRLEKMHEKFISDNANTVAPRPKVLTRVRYGGFKAITGRQTPSAGGSSSILCIEEGSLSEHQMTGVNVDGRKSTTFSGVSSPSNAGPFNSGLLRQQQRQAEEENNPNVERDNLMDSNGKESPLVIEKDD